MCILIIICTWGLWLFQESEEYRQHYAGESGDMIPVKLLVLEQE